MTNLSTSFRIKYLKSQKAQKLILNFLSIMFLFIFGISIINAQCGYNPADGCPGTDYNNAGWNSNNNAGTIEYDNFISSYHSTVIRSIDGSFKIWGEFSAPNGSNFLSPTVINVTNFSGLEVTPGVIAKPLKVAKGGNDENYLLTDQGIFVWGKKQMVTANPNPAGTTVPFQLLTVSNGINGLPPGVSPNQVKMFFATIKSLAILTCSGDVWVISQLAQMCGNGSTADANTWYKVKTSSTDFLTNIIAVRGSHSSFIALKDDGTLWTWGLSTFLGNNTAASARNLATSMTLPNSAGTIKMIGTTSSGGRSLIPPPTSISTYYVLYTDGNLYSLGNNGNGQIGDWTSSTRTSWVQPRYSSASGPVMSNIKWISPNEHQGNAFSDLLPGINVINNDKELYAWGNNEFVALGLSNTTYTGVNNPSIPSGITAADKIIAVETGGHTTMVVKECSTKFGYVGHRINGSMGNGDSTNIVESTYTYNTADVEICGTPAVDFSVGGSPTLGVNGDYCVGSTLTLNGSPAGGTYSISSGSGTISGNLLTPTSPGTITVNYTLPPTICGVVLSTTKDIKAESCGATNLPPTANNVTNAGIPVNAGITALSSLSATDSDGTIASYTITSLPLNGVLSLNGTPVIIGQTLNTTEAGQLSFTPNGSGAGTNSTFAFTATDNSGSVSPSAAIFTIPLLASGCNAGTLVPILMKI